jgi:hypothetical protein
MTKPRTVAVIVLPRCKVGRSAYLDATEGDRLLLDPEDAHGLIERGLVKREDGYRPERSEEAER